MLTDAARARRRGCVRSTPTLAYDYCGPMRQTTGLSRMPEGGRIAFALAGSGPAIGLFRVVQITPPELPCSIIFGKGVGSAAPGWRTDSI
jgi:hypothetical protein